MTALLDTSVLIDYLRGRPDAVRLMQSLTEVPLSSEICRVELLQGLRGNEEEDAAALTAAIDWVPVVEPISVRAGELGRRWRPSHSGIGIADLVIAATAELTDSALLTLNVKHFPMIEGLQAPYWAPGDGSAPGRGRSDIARTMKGSWHDNESPI